MKGGNQGRRVVGQVSWADGMSESAYHVQQGVEEIWESGAVKSKD